MNAANDESLETYPESTPVVQPVQQRRVSWGAVFGGLSVAVVVQLALSILGIGLGASTVALLPEQNPAEGLGIGSAIWMLLSGLISLFCGAWVAGRLAYSTRKSEGLLHGVLMWSVATLVTVFLLVTTAGAIIGGVGTLIGGALGVGQQAKAKGEQKAREVGEGAAKTVSTTALMAFLALVLGAVVSAWGGNVGARYWPRFISRSAMPA